MKFTRTALNAAILVAMGAMVTSANAELTTGTILAFDDSPVGGTANDPEGAGASYFTMAVSPGTVIFTGLQKGQDGGLVMGLTQDTNGHASHPGTTSLGLPLHSGVGGPDDEWGFYYNAGLHFTTVAVTVVSDGGATKTLDFSGWNVTWNGIPAINMGGGFQDCGTSTDGVCVDSFGFDHSGTFDNGTQLATITCSTASCSATSTFTLDYEAIVPVGDVSGFGGVPYTVHWEGVVKPADVVEANDDSAIAILDTTITIEVLANDEPPAGLDPASVILTSDPSLGIASANPDGSISYTAGATIGMDSFSYSVDNTTGTKSDSATVTVDVQENVPPVANNFTAGVDEGATTNINVLSNVTDTNDNVDPTTVEIIDEPSLGNATVNANGTIQYIAPPQSGSDALSYRVSDTLGKVSNTAVITISITDFVCEADTLPEGNITNLFFEPGVPGHPVDNSVPTESGSFFTMQVRPETLIFTVLEPGSDGGISLFRNQPAANSHTGLPIGDEDPLVSVDRAWEFFFNTGWDYTKNGGIKIAANGCLDFTGNGDTIVLGANQGAWIVTWNGIPAIDLGGCVPDVNCPDNVTNLGIASIDCSNPDESESSVCADGSHFQMRYAAHVPVGDPSGFGGVPYTLFMNGVLGSMPATLIPGSGTLGPGPGRTSVRLDRAEVPPETETDAEGNLLVSRQCMGDCFDYEITGVTGSTVTVIIPLSVRIPENAQFRIFKNGAWKTFDTSNGVDSIKSAPYTPGDGGCPASAAAYTDHGTVLKAGDQCLLITKSDNGPNDTNPADGIVADPSGVGVSIAPPPPPPFRPSGNSGCSVTGTDVTPWQRGDWWLLAGMLAWYGWRRRGRKAT